MKKQYIAPEHIVFNIASCEIIANSDTGVKVDPTKPGNPGVGSDAAQRRQSDWSDYERF